MFQITEHFEYSDACFFRSRKPENRDLCICADFNTLPSEYGKGMIRIVMDGMSVGNGKEAVELAAPVLYRQLVGPFMALSRELALYIEQCMQEQTDEDEMYDYIRERIHFVLLDGLRQTNNIMRQSRYEEPHCTVSAAVVFYRRIYTANLGDSPIFLMDLDAEEPALEPLYVCDNLAGAKLRSGALTEEQALHSRGMSLVDRFLGWKQDDLLADREIHFKETPLPQSCLLMLGSDGALSQVLQQDMAQAIRINLPAGLSAVMASLQHMVERSGSVDDFTLLMDLIESD